MLGDSDYGRDSLMKGALRGGGEDGAARLEADGQLGIPGQFT